MNVPVKPLPAGDLDHVFAQTRELWPGASGQSFFITGGTGFFGRWLLESFARANDRLALGMRATVLTRDPAAFARSAPHLTGRADIACVQGDLRTFAFPAGRFDHLIHAAADTAVWTQGKAADGLIDAITAGTRRLLDFAAAAGVKNLLLVSSGAVYGQQPAELAGLSEDFPGKPDPRLPGSIWGEGKRLAEHLCTTRAARDGCAVKIARCFSFVGPLLPLDAQFAVGNFIRDALSGGPIRVNGDGTTVRSYLYAGDLAVCLWTLLFKGVPGRAYNVGSGDASTIAELARLVAAELCPGATVEFASAPVPGRPPSRYVPDVSRLATEFGWSATVPLRDSIRQTAAWFGSSGTVNP